MHAKTISINGQENWKYSGIYVRCSYSTIDTKPIGMYGMPKKYRGGLVENYKMVRFFFLRVPWKVPSLIRCHCGLLLPETG